MLIDSVYGKDKKYYHKVFLEKYHFIEDRETYCSNSDEDHYYEECISLVFETLKKDKIQKTFLSLRLYSSLLKYKKFSNFVARNFHFLKYKKFLQSRFFLFFELRNIPPEI